MLTDQLSSVGTATTSTIAPFRSTVTGSGTRSEMENFEYDIQSAIQGSLDEADCVDDVDVRSY